MSYDKILWMTVGMAGATLISNSFGASAITMSSHNLLIVGGVRRFLLKQWLYTSYCETGEA